MRIAVLSGKGGTGKTFIAVNLAVASGKATYVDCDAEEPNGRLFLKPNNIQTKTVYTLVPKIDYNECIGCRKCVDFCRLDAMAFVKNKPIVFPEVCHSCGGCTLVCSTGAITEQKHPVGVVEMGDHGDVKAITGVLNIGQESAVPVIASAIEKAESLNDLTVLDCPPGTSCPVRESIQSADFCILVAEPTSFGFHNFKMVHELVSSRHKPCGVIINREGDKYPLLDEFCKDHQLNILARYPYSEKLAHIGANAEIACEKDEEFLHLFRKLLYAVEKEANI